MKKTNVILKNGYGLKTNKFIIVVTVYNAVKYTKKCIDSILSQTYKNFELVVIDDCSTDGTSEVIVNMWKRNFKYYRNNKRIGSAVGNVVKGVKLCPGPGEDIIVTVDGDDWLYDDGVLEYLNGVYSDPDIWLTYGQFISLSGKLNNFCKPITSTINYRRHGIWSTSHLRTFKRKLWNRVNDKDLRFRGRNYYTNYEDTAYMFPMIEMAGIKRIRFIDKILYVYNDKNPLCTINNSRERMRIRTIYPMIYEIRRKKPYREIHK